VAHRTLSCAQAAAPHEPAALEFSQRESAKIHRTVWCATRLSSETMDQRSTSPNGRLRWLQAVCSAEVKSQSTKSEHTPDCPVCHQTVRCSKKIEVFNGQLLQTPTVGWRGTHRTVNGRVSGAPPDCPVCPSATTIGKVVGAINTPNHHHSSYPSFSVFSFNTRARNTLQRHNQSIQSSPSSKIKSSDQKRLMTWERVICVCFVALVALVAFFFFSF
jgi:hypothetical protein